MSGHMMNVVYIFHMHFQLETEELISHSWIDSRIHVMNGFWMPGFGVLVVVVMAEEKY